MTDDIELLRRYARTSSEEAFAVLVHRHIDFVYATALRQVQGTHRAEDVVQAVFIALAQKAAALCRRKELVGWLYISTHYAATDIIRKEARREARERTVSMIPQAFPDSAAALDWEKLHPVLDAVLRDLSRVDRDAVLLRFFKDRSFDEIGAALQISEEAARKRVERALEKMRPLLVRRGITSTTGALAVALMNRGAVAAPAELAAHVTSAAVAAGTAAAAGTALSLGTLMNLPKLAGTLAVVVALVATGSLINDWRSLRASEYQLEAATTTARSASDALLRQSDWLGRRSKALEGQIAQLEASRRTADASPATDPAHPYLSDPTYRELYKTSKLALRHFDFRRFYDQIGLSPENIGRFENIMVRQDLSNLDAMIAKNTGADEKAVNVRSAKEWNSGMDELLGPDGKKLLEDYLKYTSVRTFFDSMGTLAYPIGDPITVEQSDQLLRVALANDSIYQKGTGTDPGNIDWDAMWEPAAKILSSEQLATLHTMAETFMLKRRIQESLNAGPK